MEGGFHPPCLVHVNRKSPFVNGDNLICARLLSVQKGGHNHTEPWSGTRQPDFESMLGGPLCAIFAANSRVVEPFHGYDGGVKRYYR
jgi:hypothetical protein